MFLHFLLRLPSLLHTLSSHIEDRHPSRLLSGQTWRRWGYLLDGEELVWSGGNKISSKNDVNQVLHPLLAIS